MLPQAQVTQGTDRVSADPSLSSSAGRGLSWWLFGRSPSGRSWSKTILALTGWSCNRRCPILF